VDRLARQGVLFERAIAASTLTAPSHASIMTSRYLREHSIGHGIGSTRLSDETSLAMLFKAAGYETAAFVGNVNLARSTGLGRGFEVYDDQLPQVEGARGEVFERTAEHTSKRALSWLAKPRDRPFLLWVHYQDPHGPYTPPAPYDQQFQLTSKESETPLVPLEKHGGPDGVPAYQVIQGVSLPSDYRNRYAGEIKFFDRWFGRLMDALEEAPARETIILLTADHGESMGEEGYYFSHGYATTPNLSHVPFLLSAPGLAPGRRSEVVHHVDVLPTLLHLAGLELPGEMSGIAIGKYLEAKQPFPDRLVYSDTGNEISAYRGGDFLRLRIRGHVRDFKKGDTRSYRWSNAANWEVTSQGLDPVHLAELQRYRSKMKPLQKINEPLSDETKSRLRALGYID
jgi:arylsulfatase